jgi:hypothetical protein
VWDRFTVNTDATFIRWREEGGTRIWNYDST